MKDLIKILAILGIGTLSISSNALAIPYQSATVYKAVDNAKDIVVFSGTPGSRVSVSLGSVPRPVARLAGSCGEVRISPPASGDFTGLQVDGQNIDTNFLPTQTLPSCTNGVFAEARTANFKTPTGQVIIVGKTPGAATSVSLPSAVTRSVTINACGFGILRASSGSNLPNTFAVGTTNYDLGTLPNAQTAPYCRTVNGAPFGYVPTTW